MFVRLPEPGFVKTRRGRVVGARVAAGLYEAFVRDLVAQMPSWPCRVFWAVAPAAAAGGERARRGSVAEGFAAYFGLSAEACFEQSGPDLGARLAAAFARLRAAGARRCLAIGSDLPHLPTATIETALARLEQNDLVLGPTRDGGYYLIGLARAADLFSADIAWSTNAVYAQTQARSQALRLRLSKPLEAAFDIDEIDDLRDLRLLLARNPELRRQIPATAAAIAALPGPSL